MKQLQLNQKVKQNVLNCRIIEIPKLILQCNLIFNGIGYLKLLNHNKRILRFSHVLVYYTIVLMLNRFNVNNIIN